MTQAFLWADLDEEVYVTAPTGYDLGRNDHGRPLVFRVLKAIYGLKQNPACWYKPISRWLLVDQDYQQSGSDQCMFHAWCNADGQIDPSQSPDDQHDDYMFIGFHVGDFLTVTADKHWETEFFDSLRSRFDIMDLGEPTQLLGLNIERDKTARSLKISCPTVLNDMLENTGMTGAYPTTSPAMNPEPSDLITADNEYRHEGLDPAKVIGSMQYAASSCRWLVPQPGVFHRRPKPSNFPTWRWSPARPFGRFVPGKGGLAQGRSRTGHRKNQQTPSKCGAQGARGIRGEGKQESWCWCQVTAAHRGLWITEVTPLLAVMFGRAHIHNQNPKPRSNATPLAPLWSEPERAGASRSERSC